MRTVRAFSLVFSLAIALSAAPAEKTPHEIYDALNALRADPSAVYDIKPQHRIELRRSDLKLSFEEGRIAFLAPFEGQVTGLVFSGRGHALAAPRDPVEKQQMGHFLGTPVLDQEFLSAYLRFTDGTPAELLGQLNSAGITPETDAEFAARWDPIVAGYNPSHSLRVLFHYLSSDPRSYFYATIAGAPAGPFDFLLDLDRPEPFFLGQSRKNRNRSYFDAWASYAPPGFSSPIAPFRALQYSIDTTILADVSLQATAAVRLRSESGAVRYVAFQLARSLVTDAVEDSGGHKLSFFQNEGMTAQQSSAHGNDALYVVLPAAVPSGQEFTLRLRYHGNVIANAGNGVLFVGAHESWYPRLGEASSFADYDLTLRWPRKLRLVATGSKVEEREEGEQRIARWQTEKPVSVIGFNLGDYATASVSASTYAIDIFANRQLEQSVSNRIERSSDLTPPMPAFSNRSGRLEEPGPRIPTPNPTDLMKQLGKEIDSSIRFYEAFSGPFPFRTLAVSQIPGTTAQAWPGLLYLPTFSYLPPEAQHRAGLSSSAQEHFSDLAPFHEVAHQWWGNLVGWSSYRDQWIDEAISNYLAVLFANTQKNPEHTLRVWMERFRHKLVTKPTDADGRPADTGALVLGSRLDSSRSPEAYEQIIYSKGTWVMHMLREMLHQPGSKAPDARFATLLHNLVWKYSYRALSTADFQREVESVMTPAMALEGGHSMDWFFDQWVRGTGIPHYRVEFTTAPSEQGFTVRGKVLQSDVPRSFIAPVPLYFHDGGRSFYLGTVNTTGPETSFHFNAAARPRKLLIDPQLTLLCTSE
jgi:peptidase M1-like protein